MLLDCWEGAKSFGNKVLETCEAGVTKVGTYVLGGGMLLLGGTAQAQEFTASEYISQMNTAATQIKGDVAAALPIALGVAAVSVGIFIVWRVFKRLANG